MVNADSEVIGGFWKAVMNMGIAKVNLVTKAANSHNEVIIESGEAHLFAADDPVIDEAKYIVI